MNEKSYKTIIIVLSVVAAISVGLCIYFGTANPSRTGEELANTIKDNEFTIRDQERTILALQSDLSAARGATASALERAGDAERELGSIVGDVRQSAERINRLGTGASDLIERQRIINELFGRLATNYSQP